MRRVNRDLIVQLLADEMLSFREIARRASCSDWTVRSIARELDDGAAEEVTYVEPLTGFEWCAAFGIGAIIIAGLSLAAWRRR